MGDRRVLESLYHCPQNNSQLEAEPQLEEMAIEEIDVGEPELLNFKHKNIYSSQIFNISTKNIKQFDF